MDDMNVYRGFTFLEMLVVLSIVSIMLLLSANAYSDWLARTKTQELAFELQRSISLARSLALKHGGGIRLCGSDDGATCTGSMQKGWIIFHDLDDSGQVEATENVARVYQASSGTLQISMVNTTDSASINEVSFNYKGYSKTSIAVSVQRGSVTESFTVSRSGYVA